MARRPSVERQVAGSTGTTSSTSSYEAAIKNALAHDASLGLQRARLGSSSAQKGSSSSTQATSQQQPQHLIKVPKLSKQSHLLNRPLPRVPTCQPPVQTARAPVLGVAPAHRAHRTTHTCALGTPNRAPNSRVSSSAAHISRAPFASASTSPTLINSLNRRQTSSSTKQQKTEPLSTNLDEAAEPLAISKKVASNVISLAAPSAHRTAARSSKSSSSSSHPSPTVTTYTSSGISSRLTTGGGAGTTATPSAATITSSSSACSASARSRSSAASLQHHQRKREALTDVMKSGNRSHDDDDEKEEATDENRMLAAPSPLGGDSSLLLGGDVNGLKRNNLRLFDEKFSSKFMDQQMASSNDSLLESIDFSGTLNLRANISQFADDKQRI